MTTELTWETKSTSLENTLEIAKQIGQNLRGGEVIELISDLGGGKTAFAKGLASGMGYQGIVRSPSFTVGNQYDCDKLTLHHFDFYRLHEAGIISSELTEILEDPKAVVVIEWAELVADVIPDDHLTITITTIGDLERKFEFLYPDKYNYLFPTNT